MYRYILLIEVRYKLMYLIYPTPKPGATRLGKKLEPYRRSVK